MPASRRTPRVLAARLATLVLVAIATALAPEPAAATPGDTLLVRTFTFDSIATRRAVFPFPESGSWEKILMRYTLKCDERTPGDANPCGEWDVTTHVRVRRATGRQDSTRLEHALFLVDGVAPDAFARSTAPRWRIRESWAFDPADGEILPGRYLRFEGTDCLRLPAAVFATVDSAFTLELWVKGDVLQPRSDQLFEASDKGARVINLSLPWADGSVRFEAGGKAEGNNNRLELEATPGQWKGRWNHWAFVKDARAGVLRAYLNGELVHEAGKMGRTMEGITQACLGSNSAASGGWFAGAVDEVRIWDAALDGATIAAWRQRRPGPGHPDWSHLRASYRFEEGLPKGVAFDSSPHGHHASAFGQPEVREHGFEGGQDRLPGPHATLRVDSALAPLQSIRFFEEPADPRVETAIVDAWPAVDLVHDGQGVLLERRPAPAAEVDTLLQETRVAFGAPFDAVEAIEVARYITPYGLGLDLGEDGFTWVVDVSVYEPWLKGAVDLEAHNGYELLDLDFLFVEGVPARPVLSIEELWPTEQTSYGDYAAGVRFAPKSIRPRADADGVFLLTRISGHGHAGPRNCCEWTPKEHLVSVAGLERHRWTIWRNCGFNPVHPQGGTWQFDRAGWCPGTFVDDWLHPLTPWARPGEETLVGVGVEAPDPLNGEAEGYFIVAQQLLQTGPPSFGRDAELLAVLAPSAADEQRRLNPSTTGVWLQVRNRGSQPLEELIVEYGVAGEKPRRERWQGRLEFLEVDTLRLPPLDGPWPVGARLAAEIRPAQGRDEYPSNNRLEAPLPEPPRLPRTFIVAVKTPGFGRAADNAWRIENAAGEVAASRSEFADDSLHLDEVSLAPGAWRFVFEDAEQDGLIRHWWLRGSAPDRVGENGRVELRSVDGAVLVDLGYDFAERAQTGFFVE